jgi:hypothetical protein
MKGRARTPMEAFHDSCHCFGQGRNRQDQSDRAVTLAQMQERAVVEMEASCVGDIRQIWDHLNP